MYTKADINLWSGRSDTLEGESGKRWHQMIQPLDINTDQALPENMLHIAFLGFASDEGVRRNKGRQGAAQAPSAIRKAMANLPWHFNNQLQIWDAGDVYCNGNELETAQTALSKKVNQLIDKGIVPILLGGGHEIAFPHYAGLHQSLPNRKIGIINIDAHFDLRKPEHESSSGTPFYEMAQLLQQNDKMFKYLCLGIQETGNTKALFDRAKSLQTEWITAETLKNGLKEDVFSKINRFIMGCDAIYLTTCMDVFDASVAPGVSAPCVDGLTADVVKKLYDEIIYSGRVISTDLAELNPFLDIDSRTARLVAHLIYYQVKFHHNYFVHHRT